MKYFYIGLALAGLLVLGCYGSRQIVTSRAAAVAGPVEQALEAFRAGDAAEARSLAAEAAAEWGRQEKLLASLVSHTRINGIGQALEELALAPEEELGSRLAGTLRALRELAALERADFENIL